jgi:single-stranded DNA-binding protein
VTWRRTAEVVAQYLRKGRLIEVVASPARNRTWTDRNGQERTDIEHTAYRVQFVRSTVVPASASTPEVAA